MATRPLWKGSLKLSLISIPIRVFAATDPAGEITFRQLHARCGTPIQLRKWCPHCEVDVENSDIVKGYTVGKDRYVRIDPDDIASVRPESTHTIAIEQVVDAARVHPLFIERPYYVAPDNAAAGSAFAVLRDALGDRAGVGKVALHGREYLVAIRPYESGLVMYTLRHGDEIRAMDGIDELKFAHAKAKASEVKLARQILDGFESDRPLTDYHDDYEDALRKMIAAKQRGKTIAAPAPERPARVVNLMDALRQSLDKVKTERKTTRAPAGRGRKARVLKHRPAAKRAS
jgi:DNA end-binding protein Ku